MKLAYAVLLAAMTLRGQTSATLEEGRKALDEKRYADAARLLGDAVHAGPADITAQFDYALALSLLNRDADAITVYERILAAQPGIYEAQLNSGILYVRTKNYEKAVAVLKAASAQKPNEWRPLYFLGEAELGAMSLEDAETTLHRALTLEPKAPEAMLALGRAVLRQGRVKESATWYESAAAADAAYRPYLLELAEALDKAGHRGEAAALYQRFPENPGAAQRAAVLLLESGKAAEAVAKLEEVVKTAPTPANQLALATAYLRNHQNEQAAPLLAAALQREPQNVALHLTMGRVLRDQRKFPAAAREFLQAAQLDPKEKMAWSELAAILVVMQDYEQALKAFDKLRALGSETAGQWYLRALAHDHLRQLPLAKEAYEKFLVMSTGQNPDEEFKARQRLRIVTREIQKR